MTKKDFSSWMDGNGVTVAEAAKIFGCAENNIYKWRSRGIPERKADWIASMIASYDEAKGECSPNTLSLKMSDADFDLICEAALEEGMIPREWALETIRRAAQRIGTTQAFRLNEDPPEDT